MVTMSSADLLLAQQAARAAGDLLLEHWTRRDELSVSRKRGGDFVTDADVASEQLVRETLLDARPHDQWLGEETGAEGSGGRRWIVDPLDGTTNFLRGIAHWAVSIALEHEGRLTVGVVFDPVKNEMFAAEDTQGATLNGQPVEVAHTDSMADALLGTGVPFGQMPYIDEHAADIAKLMPHCAGVRRMGAASLDLAYVAAGRLDGFWERRLQLWDIAAGLVLLREAGARLESWQPDERPEDTGTVIAAPEALFGPLSAYLNRGSI